MAILTWNTVVIEFAADSRAFWAAGSGEPRPDAIHVIQSGAGEDAGFTLHRSGGPGHALTGAESEELLSLLRDMAVAAPWQADVGLDGATSELVLLGPMSQAAFRWWGWPPPEWEGVGRVFRYVIKLVWRGDDARLPTGASS